ncbi:probable protein phosphatase 2C 43 [Mangifera indica]|uniref:probable protein phosphatase 2C 43 n=1 Tax=Mangifera indica TaxID=29780 RepID=UPI001CFAE72C|nr:probable protein phosphatase 2C 43 [Mangifera indica]
MLRSAFFSRREADQSFALARRILLQINMWNSPGLWRNVKEFALGNNHFAQDSLIWSRDLEKHCYGDLSCAQVQANNVMEDYCQVKIRPDATFVGVYDGRSGPEAARFICDNLFLHLTRLAQENGAFSEDILRSAISATEDGFLSLVRRTQRVNPSFVQTGSCCLVGVIWSGTLYVANLGGSIAVIGSLGGSNEIVAEQLTREHNANVKEVREELKSMHPDDKDIVNLKHGVWRIKGIIQTSRSIGDAYLKRPEFSAPKRFAHLSIRRPVLTAEPSIYTRVLQPNDKFIIFASDGLWEHLSNQEAADVVHKNPRNGIAWRLLKTALTLAAKKREMTYKELQPIDKGIRRHFHDDISVIVIFIDHQLMGKTISLPELSIRGFLDTVGP